MMHPDALVGAKIDNYTVTRHLARGGMADVYLARNVRLQRDVVLKILLPSYVENIAFVERFRREAQAMARLQHNGIVQVYDTGDTPDGRPFIAMQYVRGGTLEELLEKLESEGQMMTPAFALAIARQVVAALGVAHAAGIVHRDLKPSNILLDEQRRPILTDLGIAYVQDTQRLTRTDTFIGTPHYMSPEQGKGQPLDARSDIYSLGVVLFEMLAGQRPFPGDSHWALIHQHTSVPAPAPSRLRPGLPRAIDRLVGRCLEKDPGRRFQSAGELAAALDRALAEAGSAGVLTASGEWQWQPRQSLELFISREGRLKPMPAAGAGRNNRLLLGVLGMVALVMAGGLWIIWPPPTPPPTPPPATLVGEVAEVTETPSPTPVASSTVMMIVGTPTVGPTASLTVEPATDTGESPATVSSPATDTATTAEPDDVAEVRITRNVFTRNGPGLAFAINGSLGGDAIVTIVARDRRGDWYLVQPATGDPAWVSADFVTASAGTLADVPLAATIPVPPTPTPTDTPEPTNTPVLAGGGGGGSGGSNGTGEPTPTNTVVSPPTATVVRPED